MKMKKMEQEMEEVFEMKVQEKLQKLKDIEADVRRGRGRGGREGEGEESKMKRSEHEIGEEEEKCLKTEVPCDVCVEAWEPHWKEFCFLLYVHVMSTLP